MLSQDLFGIKGDGVTDDGAAINAYSAAIVAAGGTQIDLAQGRVYRVGQSLLTRQNVTWDFHGSTVISGVGYPTELGIFANPSDVTKVLIGRVTSDIVGPTSQLPLSSVSGLTVGCWVAVRLGNNPWDNNEARYSVVAQVASIDGDVVTLDWVIPYSIPITRSYTWPGSAIVVPPATADNSSVWLLQNDFPLNVNFRNMVLVGDTGISVEGGIRLQWGANLKFDNVIGNPGYSGDMGAGLIVLGHCRNVRVNDPLLGCNSNTRGQPSCGKMFSFWNCVDIVVRGAVAKNCHDGVGFIEGFSEQVAFDDLVIIDRAATALPTWNAFAVVQGASVRMNNPSVITDRQINQFRTMGGGDSFLTISGVFTWRGPIPGELFNSADMRGVLDFANPTDGSLIKQFYDTPQEFGAIYGGFPALVNARG
jgi:hypothetical protein